MQTVYLGIDIGGTKTLLALFSTSGQIQKKQKFPTPQSFSQFQTDLTTNLSLLLAPVNPPSPDVGNPATTSPHNAASSNSNHLPSSPVLTPHHHSATSVNSSFLPKTTTPPKNTPSDPTTSPTGSFKASEPYHIASIAIAVPGTADGPIATSLPNLPHWHHADLAQTTRDALSSVLHLHAHTAAAIPVALNNDAAIATAYEARGLSGKTIYLTFSTGIGGGLAQDGSVTPDSAQFEPGHHLYNWHGHSTQWEHFASARALERDYYDDHYNNANSHQNPPSFTPDTTPDTSSTPSPSTSIASTSDITTPPTPSTTDTTPVKLLATHLTSPSQLRDIAHRLSIGLSDLIATYHPDHLIIGGPLGDNFPLYKDDLTNLLHQSLPDATLPDIIQAKHPQESTIYGCYLFAHHLNPQS